MPKPRLFITLFFSIACCCLFILATMFYLRLTAENQFSYIAADDQQELQAYAQHAERLIVAKDFKSLAQWRNSVMAKEQVWLSIVKLNEYWLLGEFDANKFDQQRLTLAREVHWPIHLDHELNPIIDFPLVDNQYHLLIELPERMRPGVYFSSIIYSVIVLFLILAAGLLSIYIYRHINSPLQELKKLAMAFSNGNYQVRAQLDDKRAHDELFDLAEHFNVMAQRIEELMASQRQLIQAISHELKTPITRLQLVIELGDETLMAQRVAKEVITINSLVEDALTLAWLDNEKPVLTGESVDLLALIDSIVDDAKFEFPENDIALSLPQHCELSHCNHRALGQAIENILRNAMKYSPKGSTTKLSVQAQAGCIKISICDQGPGVPEQYLQQIFQPFFRVDKARERDTGGHGLGLSLVERQCHAMGGEVKAFNQSPQGLCVEMSFYR